MAIKKGRAKSYIPMTEKNLQAHYQNNWKINAHKPQPFEDSERTDRRDGFSKGCIKEKADAHLNDDGLSLASVILANRNLKWYLSEFVVSVKKGGPAAWELAKLLVILLACLLVFAIILAVCWLILMLLAYFYYILIEI